MTEIRNSRPARAAGAGATIQDAPSTTRTSEPKPATPSKPADGLDSGRPSGHHVATDRAGSAAPEGGLNQLGLLSASRAGDPTWRQRSEAEIDSAVTLLRQLDANDDGKLVEARLHSELEGLQDPMARAIFDFANFGNYSGQSSFYGRETRGDVMSGGLGLGYTLRPEHYTSHGYLSEENLDAGVRELKGRLAGQRATGDLAAKDLGQIAERAAQQGLFSSQGPERFGELHAATERLLDHIQTQTEKKELATRNSSARLTLDELFSGPAALPEGSLERLIADEIVRGQAEGDGGGEHWMDFFKRGIDLTSLDERGDQRGQVGDMLQHYMLVVGKRAKETQYLEQVKTELAKRLD